MDYLRPSGRLVKKKALIMLKNILKILQHSRLEGLERLRICQLRPNRIRFEKTQLHRKQAKILPLLRVKAYSFQATHALRASSNNFPNAIWFDYK